jgi:hypothetical protein
LPFGIIFCPKRQICDRLFKPCQTLFLKKAPKKGERKRNNTQGPKSRQAKQPKNKGRTIPFSRKLGGWPIGDFSAKIIIIITIGPWHPGQYWVTHQIESLGWY